VPKWFEWECATCSAKDELCSGASVCLWPLAGGKEQQSKQSGHAIGTFGGKPVGENENGNNNNNNNNWKGAGAKSLYCTSGSNLGNQMIKAKRAQ